MCHSGQAVSLVILSLFLMTAPSLAQDGSGMGLLEAPMITNGPQDTTVTYGEDITLTCTVSSDLAVTITWNTTANTDLPDPVTTDDGDYQYNSSLTLSNVTLMYIGDYSCVAVSDLGMDLFTVTLTVEIPQPQVTVTPMSIDEYYNETITLTCQVESIADVDITWTTNATSDILAQPEPMDLGQGMISSELVLTQLTLDNTGDYTCTATTTMGNESASDTSSVTVFIPQPQVTVTPMSIDEYYNETITLTCQVESIADVEITWTTDATSDILAQPEPMDLGQGMISSELVLTQLTLDNTGDYTCTATTTMGNESASNTSSVTVFIPAPNVSVAPDDTITLVPGTASTASFTCTVVSFTDVINVTWTTTADQIVTQPSFVSESEFGVYTSVLTIDGVLPDNGGVYMCTAVNEAGMNSDTGVLNVTIEVPSVTVTVDNAPASNHSVEYNGTLVLTCSVVSYGETQTLVWSVPKNKPFAREDANDSVSIYNSTITLEQVGIDHRGIYTCSVSNTAGTGSGDVNVTVYVPPPTIEPISDLVITAGRNLSVECVATGINLTYEWSFNPQVISCYTLDVCVFGEDERELTILNIPVNYSSDLTCTVTDIVGQMRSVETTLTVNGLELVEQTIGTIESPIIGIENKTITFNCTFTYPTDIPNPITINWTRAGIFVNESNPLYFINTIDSGDGVIRTFFTILALESFINFANPESPYRVVYNCEGVVGDMLSEKVKSDGIHIDVQFTPYFNTKTQEHPQNPTRINLGDTKKVNCYGIGNPTANIHFEDVTNGSVVQLIEPDRINGQADYTIDITEVSNLTYRCVAGNIFGNRIYQFIVIIQDRPEKIDNRTIVSTLLSFFTVRLEWTAPDNNLNNIVQYNISYSEYLSVLIQPSTAASSSTTVNLNDLEINKSYSLFISSRNGVGYSEESEVTMFRSITNCDISLFDVSLPRILITNTTFYIKWSYPELLINPLIEEISPPVVNSVVVSVLTSSMGTTNVLRDKFSYPSDTSGTYLGLTPNTKYMVKINIFYENSVLVQGEEFKRGITTLPAHNYPDVEPEIDRDALQGVNPLLNISWTQLTVEDGAQFLTQYMVTITTIQLPQNTRSKRQSPSESTTMNYSVDKTGSSFELPAKPYTAYTSQVFAVLDNDGIISTSPVTSPATVESPEAAPGSPPWNISITASSFTSVSLAWMIPESPNGIVTVYTITRTAANGDAVMLSSVSTSYTDEQVVGATSYTYLITASTSAGEGPGASDMVTTPAGVFPIETPGIAKGSGRTIIVNVPKFSTAHGPLSHYFIVVVTGSMSIGNITTIYSNSDDSWKDLGYYATAAIIAEDDNMTFTVGDESYTNYNFINYFNAALKEDTQYRVFIRLYSAANNPTVGYRDSTETFIIEFPSSLNVAAIVVPIVIIILVLIVVIVIVILVILFLRKTPKHTETFYLDEIKSTVKPLQMDPVSPPRNGTNRSNVELRGISSHAPNLSVQNSEVFTSVGQPTILLCEATGTPMPEVLWSKDGQTLQGQEYKILADGSLYIMDTDLKDDGNYIVSAYNDGGTVEESVRVIVIAPLPPEPEPAHPPQTVSEFIERMALLHASMDEQLEQEYHDVDLEWNITNYNAKLPVNNNKNRYVNIVPYDHSRVVLNLQDGISGTDYINASNIDGYNKPNAYIATQGPIPATFSDFWRMLWEFDIPTIIMVTNLKEDEKIKCHQYWPSYGASNYGDLQVNLKEIENIVDYSIRTFQIQSIHGGVAKEIRQFHFQVWPDHGVPQYATALLGFRKRIRKYHPLQRGPMAVHCSAGVGRTGTFICIDTMMRMIEIEGKIDIFNFVRHMRFRRNYMVQTSTQYEFIHEALLETIMCGDTSLPVKSLNQKLAELYHVDPVSGKSGFLSQFQTLESSTPSDEEFDCSVAQLSDNLAKTRSHKHLPPNDSRVVLSTAKYDSDYICANFIDGYRQRQCFITTQGPMKNTAGDFWRMVWEYNTSAIVMLTQVEESGIEQCVKYWPDNEQEIWGSFVVDKCQEERILPEYIVRKFSLRHIDNSEVQRTVTQFHFTNWSFDVSPKTATSLNDMIGEVLRVQRKSGNNPITVHCSDGMGRTGAFCAAFTILERVKAEQVVDVFSTVKSLRIQRPGLLESLDQYEFIHKVVVEFLTTFDNYDNFK